jgi:hypothetical protein
MEHKSYTADLVLLWDMVENSINPLQTHVGLIFSSFECRRGYIILRSTLLDLFSPSPSLCLLFHRASSHFLDAHMRTQSTGDKGWHRTSCAVHRRVVLPATMAGVRCR